MLFIPCFTQTAQNKPPYQTHRQTFECPHCGVKITTIDRKFLENVKTAHLSLRTCKPVQQLGALNSPPVKNEKEES